MRIATLVSKGQRNRGYAPPRELVGAGFATDVVETRAPVFPHTQLEHLLIQASTADGGLAAAQAGYDAIFINTFGDYGLDALRAALRIPVVGAGQATMQAALGLGRRFSIVTIWPERLRYLYEGLLRQYGFAERCASIRSVGEEDELAGLRDSENFVTDMRAGKAHMLRRVLAEIEAAFADDGADVVCLGCTCMAPIARRLADEFEAPVLDALAVGYKTTEMLLSLGVAHSPRAWRPAQPQDAVFAAMVGAARPLLEAAGEDCEVCVVASDAAE
jgi:allantoin racemase